MTANQIFSTFYYDSPLGIIEINTADDTITSLMFKDAKKKASPKVPATDFVSNEIKKCVLQLNEYFNGDRKNFDINIQQTGTPFSELVWSELMNIPFGKTVSYLELSKRIGNPKSIRAVGTCNGNNRISIIVPCHRVIGSNGDLIGYAGDLWRKKWLLEHEQKFSDNHQLGLFENCPITQ